MVIWLFVEHMAVQKIVMVIYKISINLYDENGNELTDENIYTAKIHFKCKCDKCGHEAFLTYDPDAPCILY